MIQIKDALKTNITLVLKLDDFVTGLPVNHVEAAVISNDGLYRPVIKPGGYFVFTNNRPESIRVTSNKYNNIVILIKDHRDAVLRYSLIPREPCRDFFPLDDEAHVGFVGNGVGYSLAGALAGEATDISLLKEDLSDITDLFHVLITSGSTSEAVYLIKNLGGGRYSLKAPPTRDYPIRGTRLIPLRRVADGPIPVPRGTDTVYILSGGKLKAVNI